MTGAVPVRIAAEITYVGPKDSNDLPASVTSLIALDSAGKKYETYAGDDKAGGGGLSRHPGRETPYVDLDAMVEEIMCRSGPVRLVAIDGPGGAGKSTFADRLAGAAGGAPIVHTDDFASADNPLNWWPRLLQQVIVPLKRGEAAHFQRYDWSMQSLAEWQTIEPAPIVLIEGVSSGRSEWVGHLSYLFWIETPRGLRLERAVERDGPEALDDWEIWMGEEDAHYANDPTRDRADTEIDDTA